MQSILRRLRALIAPVSVFFAAGFSASSGAGDSALHQDCLLEFDYSQTEDFEYRTLLVARSGQIGVEAHAVEGEFERFWIKTNRVCEQDRLGFHELANMTVLLLNADDQAVARDPAYVVPEECRYNFAQLDEIDEDIFIRFRPMLSVSGRSVILNSNGQCPSDDTVLGLLTHVHLVSQELGDEF